MQSPPISITIDIDPKYTIEDVRKFILNDAFEGKFQPIYLESHNNLRKPFNGEQFITEFSATIIDPPFTDRNLIYQANLENKSGISEIYCGSFTITPKKGKAINFLHFQKPQIVERDGYLHLEWVEIIPALKIELHYHKYDSGLIYYICIHISDGLWGNRYIWLQTLMEILNDQKTDKILATQWEGDSALFQEIQDSMTKILRFEEDILDVNETRNLIWSSAKKIQDLFNKKKNSVHITPKIPSQGEYPADIEFYRFAEMPKQPVSIPKEFWRKIVWNEMLDWDAPETLQSRTKEYWSHQLDEQAFLDLIHYPNIGGKSTWPAFVEIIIRRPESEQMIDELIKWTGDINWPGAGEAWLHLVQKVGKRAIPILNKHIDAAKKVKDKWWAKNLKYIITDILEAHKE